MKEPNFEGISPKDYDQLEENMNDAGKIQETDFSDSCELI